MTCFANCILSNNYSQMLRKKIIKFKKLFLHRSSCPSPHSVTNPVRQDPISKFRNLGVRLGTSVSIIEPISPVIFSSEPYLISIGSNTTISFDVAFVTHDAATRVIRNLPDGNNETVIYGPISVGENCFIGCRTTILPNVNIGNNTIIGAGSLVNSSIPDNVVAAGVPCKVICTLEEYRKKHKNEFLYMVSLPYDKKKNYLLEKFRLA